MNLNITRHPWKKNALKRLILSFICILLPLYLLSMIIYNWGIRTLQDEISKSMISQVSGYFSGLEEEFRRIQTLQYDVLSDDNLNALGAIPDSLNDIEKMQSILRLQQRLNAIRNSSTYIKDVYAYIPAIQKNVSALTISSFDQEAFQKLRNIPLTLDSQVMNVDGRMYLSAVYPFSTPSSKRGPLFIVAIELSKEKLEEHLKLMVNSQDEGLIFNSSQFVITTSHDPAFDQQITARMTSDVNMGKAQKLIINDKHYLAVYASSHFFGAVLSKYVPENAVFQPLQKYRSWFVLLAAVALFIIIIYSLYVYKYIHKPLDKLVKAFRKIEHGDLDVQIDHTINDEFQYIYKRFNVMSGNLKSLIDQVYKQQFLTQKAELKQLQSQINPHFLYNNLFILSTMARLGDYENLEQFTNQLGEYFQFVTRNSSDEVPLWKEVNHAKVYADIQAMRFSNRLRVEFDELPEHVGHVMVPRLILQPIIENAFEHGLERKPANGILRVRILKIANVIHMIVEDNGEELDEKRIELLRVALSNQDGVETTGILNIHQRIRLKFGQTSGLVVERSEWGGLKTTIQIDYTNGGV
ncbi:sensor histidine kinase [Paenibacillus qinlingensis]|uniref:Two-component system sensor histidine kinase YesM n=1 Tax=Paenibacillus qinlingensis TaxID=1837343 RepID=A0ABU1NUG7_9BACL|nr:sensor histidine kinase [Paenibacillus qinlingensis]MDR6550477.1 two-component system sensor histidine kinase YesM [Paenibacillus qinlingensis]